MLSLGWKSVETQQVRFDALATMADFSGATVLDVGCGFGDLYKYLNDNYIDMTYTGIDVSMNMLTQARKNYPEVSFECVDFDQYNPNMTFDFVFASGPFNIRIDDNDVFLERMVNRMWRLARQGVAFNVLSSYLPISMQDDFFYYYEPEKVFKICKKLAQYVVMRHDYLPNDVTFILYK